MKNYLLSFLSVVLLFGLSTTYAVAINHDVFVTQVDTSLKLRLSFDNASDGATTVADESGNNYSATLYNGAMVSTSGGIGGVLSLGSANGYLDFGSLVGTNLISKLQSFTISTFVNVANDADISGNGNFLFAFGNSDNMGTTKNGYLFLGLKASHYAITKTYYTAEQYIQTGAAFPKGLWKHVAVTYSKETSTAKLYVDGVVVASSTSINLAPKDLGATAYNYIGKSSYALNGDVYLKKSLVDEFRIYNVALADTSINKFVALLPEYNSAITTAQINSALATLGLADGKKIYSNLTLPVSKNGVTITWSSTDENCISKTGVVVRPESGSAAKNVTLTATAVSGGVTVVKSYQLIVMPKLTDLEMVQTDVDSLVLIGNTTNLRSSLPLPIKGMFGSTISWSSSVETLLSNSGNLMYLPEHGTGKTPVELTATFSNGSVVQTKKFDIQVAEKEGFSAYLFAYFTGTSEAIRFALSNDGKNYQALNGNNPVLNSGMISSTGGVRDPHIMRAEDGQTFYMVATDMVAANGWESNRGIVLLKSTDLVNWSFSAINIATTYPTAFSDILRAWAPQTIYDKSVGKYMVYFSMKKGANGIDKVYYSYANASFTALESEPKLLFENPAGTATIDADIIEKDNKYYMFMKTENAGNGIKKAVSSTLTGPYAMEDKFLDQTDLNVEGGCIYRLTDTDNYILMYDIYMNQKYQFTETSDLDNYRVIDSETSMNFAPRHGTTMSITKEEAERLAKKWGSVADISIYSSTSNSVKMINSKYDQTGKIIILAVKNGTDITNFDPMLVALAGCVVTPSGPQDFSNGAVNYTVSIPGIGSKTYAVTVQVSGNPVLDGYYADPEVLYSEKTGLFYIYPTTDGFANWGGYTFDVFSSPNLVDWTNEGTILNLKSSQVPWANGNAWAPAIIEKKIGDNDYNYYFYFSGEAGGKKIGVAVANNPTGPFADSGKPLISGFPSGVSGGQQIDVDVFNDPKSGKNYIYWGNGYMAVAELNDDMVSIKDGTTMVLTPTGGSTSDYQFREATYVFYRNGIYYFLWSVDDTGSPNYHVAYGTSTSPTGPINVAANPIVLAQDPANQIYGPAHNSILKIPGRDEWYIVYHRINKNYLNNSPGTHREVCIDSLKFNPNGTIQRVTPTKSGIKPVSKGGGTAVLQIKDDQPKGNVISKEIYSINGMMVDFKNRRLDKGVYILKTRYDSGTVTFKKIIINNQEMQNYFNE